MKSSENKTQRFYKDQFSLPQIAAFALTANWAQNQHETLLKTQHFQKLFIHKMNLNATDPIFRFEGGLLQTLRNYCSHWRYDPPRALVESEQEKWNHLARCALDELRYRNRQADDNKLNASYDFEAADLFKFEAKPLIEHGQPELAFMLAPFLTKGQAGLHPPALASCCFARKCYVRMESGRSCADRLLFCGLRLACPGVEPSGLACPGLAVRGLPGLLAAA